MTRAARELAALAHAWSRRPNTPPEGWVPPARPWFQVFPLAMGLRENLGELYERGEVTWGWVLDADALVWAEGTEPGFGRVLWCDDPYGQRFPEALGRAGGYYEAAVRRGSTAPGLRSLRPPETGPLGIERFPPLLSDNRVVWHAPVAIYREQLPGGVLRGSIVPIVRAPDGRPDRVSLLPGTFWTPELLARWRADSE